MANVNGNGNGNGQQSFTQKVVDNSLLTAVGRVTMACAGPVLAFVVISLINVQRDQALTANNLAHTNENVAAINIAIASNHTDSQDAINNLAQNVKDQIAQTKAEVATVMDLRGKLRDAREDGMQSMLDELWFRTFGVRSTPSRK